MVDLRSLGERDRASFSQNPAVVQFEIFPFYSNHLRSVISKGVSESRVFISGRVALRDLLFPLPKHKVPRPYSGAEDGAPSLTGARDDDLSIRIQR